MDCSHHSSTNTDTLSSYPRAIAEELEEEVKHEIVKCRENPIRAYVVITGDRRLIIANCF